jgi:hydrogenase maturation protease
VGDRIYQTWQEAVEREHTSVVTQDASLSSSSSIELIFPAAKEFEYLRDEDGKAIGVMLREREKLSVLIEVAAEDCSDGVMRVTVRVSNLTSYETSNREIALMYSLVSAHTILGVENGEFASLLDPPPELKDLSMECENTGTWPVLVDDNATTVLSSPILLYDHPQIAPESAGDLFDSTEIDEILSLRILTLTDEEKREMRQSDERARQILERTESMPPEQFMKLHGVLRNMRPLREETQ